MLPIIGSGGEWPRKRARVGAACLLAGSSFIVAAVPVRAQRAAANCQPGQTTADCPAMEEITVTAKRRALLGTASTASEGVVADQEIQLTPAYRPAQVLETVPGLTVTLHSGEGKASQYLMRGYNLDHGTDLETTVDGMPVNQPTHAHGQGYTDLNFMLPELADGIAYTKGPYYANVGDFGAVGSVRISYRDMIPDEATLTVGSYGFERLFAAGSAPLGDGQWLGAVEAQHYDGPFSTPDDARRENAVLRYGETGEDSDFSLTGMFYHQVWTNTTDIPFRAATEIGYFGSLDPSDGGHAMRGSLSAQYHADLGEGKLSTSAFYIYNSLNLFNDFTHYLVDPAHGDQEDQFENRDVIGGALEYKLPLALGGFDTEILVGGSTRTDLLDVGRLPSEGQRPLTPAETVHDPAAFSNHDHVNLFAGAAYAQATTHWTSWFRSVIGVRIDYQHGTDDDLLAALHEMAGFTNAGARGKELVQPKASIIFTPTNDLEIYGSAGEGFHSADLRGVDQDGHADPGLPSTPLLAKQYGEEIGARATVRKDLTLTVSVYNLWQSSETIYNPDIGTDSAGPPSDRYGFEINVTYAITKWLELYGSYSANHARFTAPFDDGTGHLGEYITDGPDDAGSLALYLHDLGPWSGGLNYRLLGNYPLSSGPCVNSAAVHDFPGVATSCANAPTAQGQINGKGYGQLNLDVHYALPQDWSVSVGVYNVLNSHAPAAEFWYVDRLKSEIAAYPDGRADIHEHPLEPVMARFTIAKQF